MGRRNGTVRDQRRETGIQFVHWKGIFKGDENSSRSGSNIFSFGGDFGGGAKLRRNGKMCYVLMGSVLEAFGVEN